MINKTRSYLINEERFVITSYSIHYTKLYDYIEGDSWDNGYFERWTVEDGLSNNSIKEIIEDDEGDLWIGTNKGLIRFNHKERTIRNYNYKDGIQSLEFVERAGCKRHDGEIRNNFV